MMMYVVIVSCLILVQVHCACKEAGLTQFQTDILAKHNEMRKLHSATTDLCYGDDSETYSSQVWATQLTRDKALLHSNQASVGENLAMGSKSEGAYTETEAAEKSVEDWYAEIKDWDFSTSDKKCSSDSDAVTGHFTQVVWKASTEVNCGYASNTIDAVGDKPAMQAYFVVCQYTSQGNVADQYSTNVQALESGITENTCSKPTVESGTIAPNCDKIYKEQTYTVTCSENFKLENDGEGTFACNSAGTLTPASIKCVASGGDVAKTCNKPTITGGTVAPDTGTISAGAKYTVTCDDKFKLKDEEKKEFTCDGSSGKLSPETIECVEDEGDTAKTCDKPQITDGTVAPDTATISAGAKYTVTCDDKFKLKDEEKKEFTCDGSSGKLSPETIECVSSASAVTVGCLLVGAIMMILG